MNKKLQICTLAILIVFATTSLGCLGLGDENASDNSNGNQEANTTEYDVDNVWIGYQPSFGLKAVVAFDDRSEANKLTFRHFHLLDKDSNAVKIISSNNKKMICTDNDKCVVYFPKRSIIGLGLSELGASSYEVVNISKLDGTVLTVKYAGDPNDINVAIFSKDNNGNDVFDETHYLGEAFVADEGRWKFIFEADKPLPKLVMAIAVFKDPRETEKYDQTHGRKYIALDIKPTASLQGH